VTDQVSPNTTASDERRHAFFILDNALIDDHSLTPHEGWLYAVIVRHVNYQTNVAFPSHNTLARKSGMSRRSVIRYIQRLEELGLIRRTKRWRENTKEHTSNHYEIVHLPADMSEQLLLANEQLPYDPEQSRGIDKRYHPYFMVDHAVVDRYGLTPYEGWLYLVIIRFVNRRLGYAFPSLSRLAETTNMSVTSVKKYLRSLEDKGLIRRIQQYSEFGGLAPNHYEVLPVVDKEAPGEEPGGRSSETLPQTPESPPVGREGHHLGQPDHYPKSSETLPQTPESPPVGREGHHLGHARHPKKTYLNRGDQVDQTDKNKQPEEKALKERDPARSAGQGDERPDPSHNVSATSNVEEATTPLSETLSSSQEDSFDIFCQQLADICKLDLDLNKSKNIVIKAAKELWKNGNGYTTADLKIFERYWYAETWQGRKGDVPTITEVLLTIRKALDSQTAKEEDPLRLIRGYEDIINY